MDIRINLNDNGRQFHGPGYGREPSPGALIVIGLVWLLLTAIVAWVTLTDAEKQKTAHATYIKVAGEIIIVINMLFAGIGILLLSRGLLRMTGEDQSPPGMT